MTLPIIFFLSLLFIVGVLFIVSCYLLAKIGIIFTFCPQGEIIILKIGGTARRYIANLRDRTINPKTGLLHDYNKETRTLTWRDDITGVIHTAKDVYGWGKKSLLNRYGIYFMGINTIYTYEYRWNKLAKEDPTQPARMRIVPKYDPKTKTFFDTYAYPMVARDVEIATNVPHNLYMLVTVQIQDVHKTAFNAKPTGHWIDRLEASVEARARQFAAPKDEKQLRECVAAGEGSDYSQAIMEVNTFGETESTHGVAYHLGVRVTAVDLIDIEINAESRAVKDALQAIQIAESRGDAVVALATRRAKAIESIGTAEADRARKMREAVGGGFHPAVALAQAIREAKPRTLVMGQNDLMPTLPISTEDPSRLSDEPEPRTERESKTTGSEETKRKENKKE